MTPVALSSKYSWPSSPCSSPFAPSFNPPRRQRRKEVDELMDEWTPEPLGASLTSDSEEQSDPASVPVAFGARGPRPKPANTGKQVLNIASYDFTGLAETIEVHAIETLQKYGVGSWILPLLCCQRAFVVMNGYALQMSTGTEASIHYSQSFSTIHRVISVFAKRGDVIAADRGINVAI
ncbi:hypothetical protein EDB86DRAFT_3091104 [Lactarius hatsudake]|nr:hypothetical protein EDB86DRAFT_3091104 [Lactarius hatsudake]